MKKLVSLILAVALLLSTVPAYADEQTPGWRGSDAAGWRYVDENGEYVAGDWVVITKGSGTEAVTKYYYIKEDTYMAKGWLQIEGDWYYFNEDGERQTGWLLGQKNDWYYLQADGKMATGWTLVGGKMYYMNESGVMLTGWQKIDGVTYYFDENGARYTGWIKKSDKWYYFGSDGKMQTGLVNVNGYWYYLDASGEMLVGWQKVNGEWKYFSLAEDTQGRMSEDNSAIEGSITGIDVSYWQGTIDWDAIKAEGVEFTFIRVGHGDRKLDTQYTRNIKEANRVGIPAGVYFYSTAQTVEEAILDAQFVIDSVQGYKISYPIVIDMEDSSQVNLGKEKITEMIIAFCDEIRAAGYTPMIYCNEYWYKNYVDFSQLDDIEHWIARYAGKSSADIPKDIWQAGSTTRLNGIKGNVDIDFAYTDYSKIITPRTKSLDTYVKTTGYWEENNIGKWFTHLDGTYTQKGWEKIEGEWYYFDEKGYLATEQWLFVNNYWQYVDEDGIRVEGWKKIGDKWYYFDERGAMLTGWQFINNKWYYFGDSHEGSMKTGWQVIGGKWYYFGDANDGSMKYGWQFIGGKWYFLSDSASDGSMKTGWQYINNKWYYFGASNDGAMKHGWQRIGGKWYYFGDDNDGSMKIKWQFINGKWYYLSNSASDGSMKTGWQKVNNIWYYMYENGDMAHDTWIGKYYVNGSGAWIKTR